MTLTAETAQIYGTEMKEMVRELMMFLYPISSIYLTCQGC